MDSIIKTIRWPKAQAEIWKQAKMDALKKDLTLSQWAIEAFKAYLTNENEVWKETE